MNLKNITEADIRLEEGNMGGLIDKIFIIKRDDVGTFGIPALDALDPLTLTELTLKDGKAFKSIYFTPNTGKFDQKIVGEEDGKSFEPMVEFSIPKVNKLSQEMLSYVANGSFILVAKTSNNQLLVIGTPEIPAKYKDGGIETGAKYADKNQVKFGFVASSRFGAYYLPDDFDMDLVTQSDIQNVTFNDINLFVSGNNTTLSFPIEWTNNAGANSVTLATDKIGMRVVHRGNILNFPNIGQRNALAGYMADIYGVSPNDVITVEYWAYNNTGKSTSKRITKTVVLD